MTPMSPSTPSTIRVVLILLLVFAAGLKVSDLMSSTATARRGGVAGAPYAAAAAAELVAAAFLVIPRTARWGARLVASGFLGAAAATALAIAIGSAAPRCRCLGGLGLTPGLALLVQGTFICLAGLFLTRTDPPAEPAT